MKIDEERNLLALARGVAGNYAKSNPSQLRHIDDLISDACLGVADAMARYDAAKGTTLVSYAYRRAVGAVIDGVRSRAPLSRGAYVREGAEAARRANPVSLEELAETGWTPAVRQLGDAAYDDHDHVLRLLKLCTPPERLVLVACVMYGYTLTEVAAWLGVTVAAAHQFKTKGLARMRAGVPARRSPRKATQ